MNQTQLEELDVVFLSEEVKDIPANTSGTIVHIYPNSETFVVEFFLENGSSKVETVNVTQIKKL